MTVAVYIMTVTVNMPLKKSLHEAVAMNIPQISPQQIELFILILLRVSSIMIMIPIISNRQVPLRIKGGLSIIVAFLVMPFVQPVSFPLEMPVLIVTMIGEVAIGIIIGLVGRLLFAGVQLAGQLVGFQMGFAIVNVVDPLSSMQVSIIAQFQYLIAMLIFLAVNGHHIFLYAIAESFHAVPPLAFHFTGPLMDSLVGFSTNIFIIAVKIGAPVMAMLLFTSVSLGLVARTVPQINVFIVGFPLKIAVGLIGIGLTLPIFAEILGFAFVQFDGQIKALLGLM
ncbi:MAG: flagellar biosynthetic protein FliR [Deltaproteobacteria bacterium]|nr:flagellar biosynthetic protein FliR [Deltaproteobacteria bacterium]MBN2688790.1 flagellar biosynthetic protein FliR [Deltaproteobacteria bacterium]